MKIRRRTLMRKPVQWGRIVVLLFLLTSFFTTNAFALELGDSAPEIKISEWIQGHQTPSEIISENKFTVLEFWSSWCPACQEAIPHLSKIQQKFKQSGVTVIGISDQDSDTVHDFVTQMGATMDYPVAVDDQEQTTQAYLNAFNIDTIPHAFIINNQGQIVWHGNPLDDLEEVMADIVDGTYDLEEAIQQAQTVKDRDSVLDLMDAYIILAGSPKEQDLARELATRMITYSKVDVELLSLITIMLIEQAEDYQTALGAMEKIVTQPEGQFPYYWEIYANIQSHIGDTQKAVESLHKALLLCDDDDERAELQAEIESFRPQM